MLLLLGVPAGGLVLLIMWMLRRIFYWQRKGVPATAILPVLGSYWPIFLRTRAYPEFLKHIYSLNSESKYIGMMDFGTPAIMVRDPELINQLGVRHFEALPDHRPAFGEVIDTFYGKMMYFLTGRRWKELNAVMRPAFTASKVRFMFKLVSETASDFVRYLLQHPEETSSIEMKDAFTRFTADAIATVAFDRRVKCMENKDDAFHSWGIHATDLGRTSCLFKMFLYRVIPGLARWCGVTMISDKSAKFFKDLVKKNLELRKKLDCTRPDIINHLTQASEKENGIEISVDDIISQVLSLFFAGYDTSSTLMSYAAYELAVNPKIQERLQNEVDRCLEDSDGVISYESLSTMKYMDTVVAETLRKYPPIPLTDRICRKAIELPPAIPGSNSITLEPEMIVFLPIYALHHDSKYFPDPDKFDPERFNKENKSKLVPHTYLPFGLGPRICLGDRFAMIQIKMILAHLLAKFVFKPTVKTPIPLRFSKKSLTMGVEGGFWLQLELRESRG